MFKGVSRAMIEYFSEWKEINENIEPAGDKDYAESLVDESEQASEFLSSVGYDDIVTTIKNGDDNHEVFDDLEAFLTKNQVATIRKRVDTLRRKGGGRTIRKDVRSLFHEDRNIQQKEIAEQEFKLQCINFKRKTSPFRIGYAEPELISSYAIRPPSGNNQDEDVVDGNTMLPVFFPDKATSICLDKTLIDDLGKRDLRNLEALAQIELMGVFDKFGIEFTKQKSKRKIKDKDGVFGVRLQTLMERDMKVDPTATVPKLFHKLLCYIEKNCLKEEGILRLSGSFTRIKEIRKEIDCQWYAEGNYSFEGLRPNDSSGLMKVFLRDLPAPLLTFEWIDSFAQISKIPNLVMQIYCLQLLMLLLPEVNRNTLKRLLQFLNKVVKHSDKNLMTEDNVAMIMAPNLFLIGSQGSSHSSAASNSGASATGGTSDLDRDLLVATESTNVILMMMRHTKEMFVVPAGLINQIREKNHENKRKVMKKLFNKKEKVDANKLPEKIQVCIILDNHCEEVHFKLRQDSTVSDVVCSLVSQLKSVEKMSTYEILCNYSLYEVGGNIEERRLDPICSIHNILKINPLVKFELRKKSGYNLPF